MKLMFDLDECLVSTRKANEEAYASLGVISPPISKHQPARLWMSDPVIYARKHAVFPSFLATYGKLLPAADLLVPGKSLILTGTSESSVLAIRNQFPIFKGYTILPGLGPEEKLDIMQNVGPGIYFDDWSEFVQRVRKETRWQAIDVSGF